MSFSIFMLISYFLFSIVCLSIPIRYAIGIISTKVFNSPPLADLENQVSLKRKASQPTVAMLFNAVTLRR